MIFNLGSINADHIYTLPHLPGPGETVASVSFSTGLGGKGANQSVAAALAGADVRHIGAVGPDGEGLIERMGAAGVDCTHIMRTEIPTAHAIVMVDGGGENQIVIHSGANMAQDANVITNALAAASPGDWLLLQNETSHQVEAATQARALGLNVAYSAAPFDMQAVEAILPYLSLLIVNRVEAGQMTEALNRPVLNIPVPNILVTKGAAGADWYDTRLLQTVSFPAFPVSPVDTTGAGDTFAGYAVAGLSQGLLPQTALRRAAAAAALAVQRPGTAEAIPALQEVLGFLDQLPKKGASAPQS